MAEHFLMKKRLSFLIKVNQLKEIPKTGWVLMQVKNPETIAEHNFRLAFAGWLLGEKRGLNLKRVIQIILSHDFAEIYARDMTPFLYWEGLNREKKGEEKVLLRGVRLSKEEKERRWKRKFQKEKESIWKIISPLKSDLKGEIFSFWLNYAKRIPGEGRFAKQVDKIETLIQSIEYFGTKEEVGGTSWWEGAEEIVEDPLLVDFLTTIQNKFYPHRKKSHFRIPNKKLKKELENILDFLLGIGKLKKTPRLYWVLRKVKNPETVAGHIFTLAIMAWIFGRDKKELDLEKLLKMALCHEIMAVETGDTTPYDRILLSEKKEREKILDRIVRLSAKEKSKVFWKDYRVEKKALQKTIRKLNKKLREEILSLWENYRKRENLEGNFLSQLNIVAVLFQGVLYKKRDKEFSTFPLWEWALEGIEDPLILEFLEALKKYEAG